MLQNRLSYLLPRRDLDMQHYQLASLLLVLLSVVTVDCICWDAQSLRMVRGYYVSISKP